MIDKWSNLFFDNLAGKDIWDSGFESIADHNSDFLFLSSNSQKESVIPLLVSDAVFIKGFECDVKEFIPLSMRKEQGYDLWSMIVLEVLSELIELISLFIAQYLSVVIDKVFKFWQL